MNAKHDSPYRTPPHDLQAEKSVLGAVMIDNSAIVLIAEFLKAAHFYVREHQLIYNSMITLFEKQQPIDIITVKDQLQSDGQLKAAGGSGNLF